MVCVLQERVCVAGVAGQSVCWQVLQERADGCVLAGVAKKRVVLSVGRCCRRGCVVCVDRCCRRECVWQVLQERVVCVGRCCRRES